MRHFSIVEPFQLNWKLVAPRDFETLEYFVTPNLSIVLHHINNGKVPFKIGSYIMGDPQKVPQFMNEIMPRRSKERIETSFENEDVSAFFTLEEAKSLEDLFDEQHFICRKVDVLYDGRPVSIPELPEDEFHKIIKIFSELKVVSTMDFNRQWEGIEEQVNSIREDVSRGIRKNQAKRDAKNIGLTKKTLILRGALAATLLTLSGVLIGISKKFLSKGTKISIVGGALLGMLSIVSGIAGKQWATNVVEYVQKGLIVKYG